MGFLLLIIPVAYFLATRNETEETNDLLSSITTVFLFKKGGSHPQGTKKYQSQLNLNSLPLPIFSYGALKGYFSLLTGHICFGHFFFNRNFFKNVVISLFKCYKTQR